jgi:AcrR family transcriptional regulator
MPEAAARAAHRPSRRDAIEAAAVRVFAREGFADANVQAVAAEAGVAPTAVYYHFAGRDALFEAALRRVLEEVYEVVVATRADDEPGDPEALGRVIDAVWSWLEDHPDECQLLYHHLPGTTTQAQRLLEEFESKHVRRGFAYLVRPERSERPERPGRRVPIADQAKETLAVRTMISLSVLVHPMRSQDGPLASLSGRTVRKALTDVATRIVALP